ncbi:MAG: PEP-CTERM sorting domain-containing protein [Deltaproteobacteria bacterium]
MRSSILFTLSALLIALSFAGRAEAVIVTFMDRASFAAAVPGATVENYDGVAAGTVIPDGNSFNGVTYNSSAGDALVTASFLPLSSPNGLGDTTVGFFLSADTITFTFPTLISAFGISVNTFAVATGDHTATTDLGDVVDSFFDPFPGFGTGQFIGFTSTIPFSSVTIAAPGGSAYTLDDLNFLAAAPEPATLLLLGSGLAAVGLFGRRKRA